MDKIWHVGIIGCGAISVNHFKALKRLENARLAAVCDIDAERLRKASEEQQAKAFADYHELLADPEIDTVHVCTPHYLHPQMAIDAMRAGKHVLCEKPMAIRAKDAEDMVKVSRETGRTLAVCFQNRYNAASQKIRETIDSGVLGEIKGGCAIVTWDRGEAYYASGAWRGKWATEGGAVLINQAIHTFDLLRWFAGDIQDLRCSMSAKRLADVIEAEDTVDMVLTAPNGARFLFYASNCGVGNTPISLQLKFVSGEIRLYGNQLTIKTPEGTITEDYTSGVSFGKDYWGSGHGFLIEDFYRCLSNGTSFPIAPEDSLITTRLLERAYTCGWPERRRPE